MSWFYFAQEDRTAEGNLTQTSWRGAHELARWSSVVLRQRSLRIFGRRFFFGTPTVEIEIIWKWANETPYRLHHL